MTDLSSWCAVLCPDDEDRGVNEARTELCKPEDAVADAICTEAIAGCSAEGKEVRISQSHSKKVSNLSAV